MRGLEAWKHLLIANGHQTVVLTDHNNLSYFRDAQRLNPRQARWLLKLSQYDILLKHVPGNRMTVPDALSRRPYHIPTGATEDDSTIRLPDELFIKNILI